MSDCYIGNDYPVFIPIPHDAEGTVIDAAGGTYYCDVQTGTAAKVAAAATEVHADSSGVAWFTSAQTTQFTAGAVYVGDITLKTAGAKVYTVGKFTFRAVAARTPTP